VDTAPPPPPAEPEDLNDVVANANAYVASLRAVRLPIGWAPEPSSPRTSEQVQAQQALNQLNGCRASGARPDSPVAWATAIGDHWLGWLITVLAISLGSPFWFDLLNRFMSIRGGGKSPEESPKHPRQEMPALGPGERQGEARQLDAIRTK
jgi:hypothetical protein